MRIMDEVVEYISDAMEIVQDAINIADMVGDGVLMTLERDTYSLLMGIDPYDTDREVTLVDRIDLSTLVIENKKLNPSGLDKLKGDDVYER